MADLNLSPTAQKVVELIEKMNVLELNDLVKYLEEKFGVSAGASMMMAQMPAGGQPAGQPAEADEQSEFDIILATTGPNTVSVVKVIRELNQALGVVEAKKLADTAPQKILEKVKKEDALAAKKKLEEAGAKVELK